MSRFSRLRILMTADAVGGVWTYAAALAAGFAARGAEVHLVVQGAAPSEHQQAMLADSPVNLIASPLALEWQDPEGTDFDAAHRFYAALQKELRPDIVHFNSYREAGFDWPCPVVVAAHSCVNSWALGCGDTAWLAADRWRRYTERVATGLRRASAWVCPTHAFREVMLNLYQPRSPGLVIWNGSARHYGEDDKDATILAAGRMWDAAKNLAVLAQAAHGLDRPVRVAGSTGDGNPAPAVQQLGELPHAELRRLMRRAAIFVSPARYEPFGLSVLEAAGAGCALVLADIPTFRELWHDAALFVDPTDAEALHSALAELCADAQWRRRLQQAARARSRRYTVRRMLDSYVALYEGLLDERLLAPAAGPRAAPTVEVLA